MDYTKFKVYKKNLVIYYSYSGKVLRYYTGIHLKDLDSKTYESSLRLINQGSIPKNLQIHKGSLSKQKNHIETIIDELVKESDDGEKPYPIQIRSRIENPRVKKNNYLIDNLDKFIEEKRRVFFSRNKPSSLKDFVSFRNSLIDYEVQNKTKLKIKDVTREFLLEYKYFLMEERPSGKDYKTKGGLNLRTIKKRFDVLRSFYKWIRKDGVNMYDNIITILGSGDFSFRGGKQPKKFNLNNNQVRLISKLKFKEGSPQMKVRDMFLVTCMLGLRFSDLVTIKKSQIINVGGDKVLKRFSVKTNQPYQVEIPDMIMSIFSKYNFDMNLMSNQKSNYYLKEILKVQSEFQKNSDTYFKDDDETIPYKLWELITFHTGRRTFITILLNEMNFSTVEVMKRTDHSKIGTLEKYVTPNEVTQKSVKEVFKNYE